MGKYFEALPFSNFLKQMVSGSKLKCPSKVSWEVSFSLYYSVIYGNCLENVVIGIEKCGKMWKNVKNVLETRFLYTTDDNEDYNSSQLYTLHVINRVRISYI